MQFQAVGGKDVSGFDRGTESGGGKEEITKNLLKHIPGEATGFYLIAVATFETPGTGTLAVLFVLSLIILLLVRFLAKASKGIIFSTLIAFAIWMLVIDNGFLAALFPDLLVDPWGLILATFYSTVITLLASYGKLK